MLRSRRPGATLFECHQQSPCIVDMSCTAGTELQVFSNTDEQLFFHLVIRVEKDNLCDFSTVHPQHPALRSRCPAIATPDRDLIFLRSSTYFPEEVHLVRILLGSSPARK